MNNPTLSACELAEVFSLLEKADDRTLRKAQLEIARILSDRQLCDRITRELTATRRQRDRA